MIVQRAGMATTTIDIINGECGYCHTPIAGVW
jgi:hypothetical protein